MSNSSTELPYDSSMSTDEKLESLEESYQQLKKDAMSLEDKIVEYDKKNEKLQQAISQLRKENEALKKPPNFVAAVEEFVDDDRVRLKKFGDNQEFIVDNPPSFDLDIGDRVEITDNLGIAEKLDDQETDARARAMEVSEKPDVNYGDIGGLEDELLEIKEATQDPLVHPEKFENVGIQPPQGVLLHGPPGTGKTLMAKAVANQTDATFLKLAASELARKFIGEGSRLVRDLFKTAEENAPAIIFIDEIDAIAAKRSDSKSDSGAEVQRTLMQLLSEMDGFQNRDDIRIIAATNRYDMLDDAILRPGRFDRIIEVGPPSESGRMQIFQIHTRQMNTIDDIDYNELAELAEGMTGADIAAVCTEAGMSAIRDDREVVEYKDFKGAIEQITEEDDNMPKRSPGFN